ncbi:hypothetical protein [Actinokineospora sp.]|uniref:hypothetical protein n=1 Tax=Actinokineospora sp. TaxID=1872133 RepID=UPI004037C104
MTDADPERLLTEALRAQAARAPAPLDAMTAPVSGYGLLSGSDLPLTAPATTRFDVTQPPRAWWILVLAVLLGLAAGSLVGLLTLL